MGYGMTQHSDNVQVTPQPPCSATQHANAPQTRRFPAGLPMAAATISDAFLHPASSRNLRNAADRLVRRDVHAETRLGQAWHFRTVCTSFLCEAIKGRGANF